MLRLRSGGQTGAERAALDWAIANGLLHEGWCPRGRRAEDGVIPASYQLKETRSEEYKQSTLANVRDSDATIIFSVGESLARLEGLLRLFEPLERTGGPRTLVRHLLLPPLH